MEDLMLNVYKICRETKAILSKDHSCYGSLILEGPREIYSIHRPEKILDVNCLSNGSSLKGRQEYAQKVLKTKVKVPIPVYPRNGIFMVPTKSMRSRDCGFLSYYQIKHFEPNGKGTYVHFFDGSGIVVNISQSSFNMQYKKTGQLIANHHRNKFFK